MAYDKPITIDSMTFEEESLPSGRKLFHLIFKQKFGTSHYKWTPPWKGDYGVESLFFKSLEIEEWNDYDGVWSKELRQASKEIPSLEDIRLPVKIGVGELTGPIENELGEDFYRLAVEILSEEKRSYREELGGKPHACIGEVKIPWGSFSTSLLKIPSIRGVSKGIEDIIYWDEYGNSRDNGIRFWVRLETGMEKSEYQAIGKELTANIRAFIRKRLSDYHALKRGFEEI